jgi:hypothetical protein
MATVLAVGHHIHRSEPIAAEATSIPTILLSVLNKTGKVPFRYQAIPRHRKTQAFLLPG